LGDAFYIESVDYAGNEEGDESGQQGKSDDARRLQQWLDEQYLRQELGFGPEKLILCKVTGFLLSQE
jgi:hypothetical protein